MDLKKETYSIPTIHFQVKQMLVSRVELERQTLKDPSKKELFVLVLVQLRVLEPQVSTGLFLFFRKKISEFSLERM